jgi:hypothetical protein
MSQRTWGREPLSGRTRVPNFDDEVPLRQDEEQSRTTFVSGHNTPPGQQSSGNHFRDEISASQRQRRQPSTRTGVPPKKPVGSDPFAGQSANRRNDEWDDQDDSEGYELQQQYTLSDPPTSYDAYATNLGAQDTSYRSHSAGPPVGRLPSMRTPTGAKVPMALAESADGDMGSGAGSKLDSGPPPPPPHAEGVLAIPRKDLGH